METVKLVAVGDTGPKKSVKDVFEKVIPALNRGDLRFAQVERTFSNRGEQQPITKSPTRREPELVGEYSDAGFDVVSLASNHSMDFGPLAALDTIDYFRKAGIATIGTGANITEARKPAILKRKGLSIAFLGYCSVLLPAYWATETRVGVAPIRARTLYEVYDWQPGNVAHIVTLADEGDLQHLREDVEAARAKADVVVVSMHWGVHFVPGYVADYQIQAAHTAIDSGCGLILGHHPHILKGIEVYKGKPILYSLGDFARVHDYPEAIIALTEKYEHKDVNDVDLGPKLKYDHKQYCKLSVIAEADLKKDGGVDLQFVPVHTDEYSKPNILEKGNPEFDEVVEFFQWSCERFNTKLEVKGDRIVIKR